MKYKVGDKVRIKSLGWYNENQDSLGDVDCGCEIFLKEMAQHCGKIMTIFKTFDDDTYVMVEDEYFWCDEMIEGLADEPQEKMVSLEKACKWLSNNKNNYIIDIEGETLIDDRIIKDFCKAMEE